jgi:ESS family glutamate:Na+ symporter
MGWGIAVTFAIVSVALLLASLLRARLRFLQRFLVPNAITAGFVGLGLMYLLEWAFPEVMPKREDLGNIVYHLLAITFISIGLKRRERYVSKDSIATAFHLSLGYAVEGFIGYSITLIFLFTLMPRIFPTFGMLFEMGFGQSSAQAYALGKQWEAIGFQNGGTVGLTFGAIGFIWACFVGVPFLNWGIRRGYVKGIDRRLLENTGFLGRGGTKPTTGRGTTHPDVIATGTLHLAFIGLVYLVDYFFIKFLVFILNGLGSTFAVQFGNILWAYHAFFATLFALLAGRILRAAKLDHILDDGMLTGISASSVDFLVTAAIMAIELAFVVQYIIPITVICIVGGVLVMLLVLFLARRSFNDYFFERVISIFGLLTGTVSSGLALLRVIDPEYRTPAASDLVLGSGFSVFIAFPLLLLINIPAMYRTTKVYLLTDAGILGYIVILFVIMIALRVLGPKRQRSAKGM